MAQVLRTFWEGGAVGSTPNTPPHQSGVRIAPTTVLTTHKTASPTLRSGSSSTLSPARSTATVTPMSSTSSSIPPQLSKTTLALPRSSSTPDGTTAPHPMSSVPTSMPSHLLATSTSCCSNRIDPSFTKEKALDHADNYLNHDNESEVIAFYEKCLSHGFPSVASAMLRAVFKHVLQSSNDAGEYRRLLPDDLPRSKQMAAFDTLAETSNNPVLLQKYAKLLADHYAKLGNASAAQESDAFNRIVGKLQARQSPATPSLSHSSSGQPPFRAAPTPPIAGGMSSTPPRPVPGRFPPSAPGPMSTSVPSSRTAPLPPPQGSFSAPPSGTSVRPGVVQSSSSSSTPVRLAESPLASPTPRLPSLQEFVSDLQRRPGLPGIDFLTAEDIKNSQHLVLEIIRSAADYKAADYNRANESMKGIVSSFEENQRTFGNSFYNEDYYLRERIHRGDKYSITANILVKYQTNTDHAWLTLFYSAADCNSVGEHLGLPPKKQKNWDCDHFSYNRFAIQRKLGIDHKIWTPEYCKRICPYVDLKWNIGDTYEEAERKGNLKSQQPGLKASSSASEDEAAFRERMGLYHYRMMGTNSIQYGGYSNM